MALPAPSLRTPGNRLVSKILIGRGQLRVVSSLSTLKYGLLLSRDFNSQYIQSQARQFSSVQAYNLLLLLHRCRAERRQPIIIMQGVYQFQFRRKGNLAESVTNMSLR